MKTLTTTIALGVLTLGLLGTTAHAEEPSDFKVTGLKCPACDAPFALEGKTTKQGTIELKVKRIMASANPKTR